MDHSNLLILHATLIWMDQTVGFFNSFRINNHSDLYHHFVIFTFSKLINAFQSFRFLIYLLLIPIKIILVEDNNTTWSGSDRDYTYDELLQRVFEIILDKNPDMAAGRKPKFVMRPPQVLRVGTKKTSFANFTEICKTLHR